MLVDHTSYRITSTFERFVRYIKRAMPEGGSLPDDVWQPRHRGILVLLWLHAIGIYYFGLLTGAGWQHSLVEAAILVAIATIASWKKGDRKFRSAMASFGLVTASAILVHLSGGYIEMHFHFFVMLALIVLYQDWVPFLLAIGYVFIHHGIFGVLAPTSVYNHPDAFAHPWKWAAIHGGFVLAASVAGIVSWRLNEALRTYSELILNSTGEGIIGLDLQGIITFMNPVAAEMTGYRVKELKGQPLYDLLHHSEADSPLPFENGNWIQTLTQSGSIQSVNEGLFWRKNGASFMAEYISTPIREAGSVVGAVVAFKDITERKQAQAALQKAKDELEIRVAERMAELKEANERLRFELAERQQMEKALRQSEERTRLIINTALDAVITMDDAGLIIDWNTQAETIFGWSHQEVAGRPLFDTIISAQYREALEQGLKQPLIIDERPLLFERVEVTALRRDGREFPIELSISPLQLGEVLNFSVFVRDITKRKQAEADLIDSEARYKAITNTMPGAIYQFTSRNGVWTVDFMAPQTLELFGVSAEDFMQDINNFINHIHPDDLPSFVASVIEAVEKLTPWNYEGRVTNPRTGELAWWQGMSTPVATTSGETIFNGILLNITERKQAEAALRQSEQRFRQVVSSISDHIYVTEFTETGQRINLYLSHHIEPLTGYPLDRFMADWSFWPSTVLHPDDRAAGAAQAERLAMGQNSELEYRLVRANGDIIWVRDSGRVERDPARQSLIIYGLVSDITERKQAEAALALARDQALESSRLKTELLAKVSHELRTPLGAILGFAEMLELNMGGPHSDRQKQMTAEIIDSTHYLTNLVNELLEQAQLEAGRLALNIHPFAPAELIDDTLAKMSVLAQAKGLSLTYDVAAEVPAILSGDAVRLQQILVNLISNAIKFTSTGAVKVRLYCPDPDRWALQVSDTGSGIPIEAQTYIFEPFRQVDGSMTRGHAGTGLGLSIVKQLTLLMGGEITLESAIGRGSVFTISLPIQPIQEKRL